jgi:hypothetical protein
MSTFEYVLELNRFGCRSWNDPSRYPILPPPTQTDAADAVDLYLFPELSSFDAVYAARTSLRRTDASVRTWIDANWSFLPGVRQPPGDAQPAIQLEPCAIKLDGIVNGAFALVANFNHFRGLLLLDDSKIADVMVQGNRAFTLKTERIDGAHCALLTPLVAIMCKITENRFFWIDAEWKPSEPSPCLPSAIEWAAMNEEFIATAASECCWVWDKDCLLAPICEIPALESGITAPAISAAFNLVVIGTANGKVQLHSLNGKIVNITDVQHRPRFIKVTPSCEFVLVHSEPRILVLLSVNGDFVRQTEMQSPFTLCEVCTTENGVDYAAGVSEDRELFFFEVFPCRVGASRFLSTNAVQSISLIPARRTVVLCSEHGIDLVPLLDSP